MGWSDYSKEDWTKYSVTTSSLHAEQIFTQRELHESLDPRNFEIRESRDSTLHPNSIPIVIGLDVTGSMGVLAESILKTGLGTIFEKLIEGKIIAHPHIAYMAIGDELVDSSPYQMTQYESEITLAAPQIEKFHREGGGGGNDFESYCGGWLLAHLKTSADNWEKRHQKGIIITIGDELPTKKIYKDKFNKKTGLYIETDLLPEEILKLVLPQWNVFHLIIEGGSFCRGNKKAVFAHWNKLLPGKCAGLSDINKIANSIEELLKKFKPESNGIFSELE